MKTCNYCGREYDDYCHYCFDEEPELPPDWMIEKCKEEK